MQGNTDFDRLLPPGALYLHDNQEVHVAVRTGTAARVGAEEDDLIRRELAHDPLDHLPDLSGRRRFPFLRLVSS